MNWNIFTQPAGSCVDIVLVIDLLCIILCWQQAMVDGGVCVVMMFDLDK